MASELDFAVYSSVVSVYPGAHHSEDDRLSTAQEVSEDMASGPLVGEPGRMPGLICRGGRGTRLTSTKTAWCADCYDVFSGLRRSFVAMVRRRGKRDI
jgi:hypothetical protein